MFSFRRAVATLAFIWLVSSGVAAFGQDSGSSQSTQEQTPAPQAPAPAATKSQGQVSVQGRIRARREARRLQAIRDTYSQRYELFIGAGYQRFKPGPVLQNATMYAFDLGLTRWYSDKLGITLDGRGNYGTAFVGLNFSSITRPAISTYDLMAGPVYRFKMRPKYSIAGRVLGGMGIGNFEADTNGFGQICPTGQQCRLYPDGKTYAFSGAIIGEANISPSVSLRLAPELMGTGYGSNFQHDLGATFGAAYLQAGPFLLAPVWWTFYWLLIAINIMQIGWKCIELARGTWQWPSRMLQIVSKAVGLIPIAFLLTTPEHRYVLLKNPATDQLHYGQNLNQVNQGLHFAFCVVCTIVVVQLAFDIGKWILESYRTHAGAAQ